MSVTHTMHYVTYRHPEACEEEGTFVNVYGRDEGGYPTHECNLAGEEVPDTHPRNAWEAAKNAMHMVEAGFHL